MSGVGEASAIFALITGSIDLIKLSIEISRAARGKAPSRIRAVAKELPSIVQLLEDAHGNAKAKTTLDSIWSKVKPDLERCKEECAALHILLETACPANDSNPAQRIWKTSVAIVKGKRSEAEEHLAAILKTLSVLQTYHVITNTQLLEDVKETLEEWGESESRIVHSGTGHNKVNTGSGNYNDLHAQDQARVIQTINYNSHQIDNAAERESRTIEELLDWLNYAGMDERREEVERAHRNTFQWIFDGSRADTEKNAGRQRRPNSDSTRPKNTAFVTWLRKETGVFWIYGKPGAGKSTLMKCIMDDPRLEEHANVWAGSHELSISCFYFWKLGSKLQKSICGLYRALIWQMLKDDRSLAREAFPGWQANFNTTELGAKALRAALNRLIKACVPRKRHLILIDGLDEYEDDESDTTISEERLSQDILQMVKSGSVKVIIASRPHRVFKCNFSHGRNLAIHDLTAWDLELYAHDRLLEDETIRPFGESVSAMEYAKLLPLVRMIVQGSHGVFLWARVAVDLARVHIRYYHDIDRLEGILEKLHPEIEELFDQIMGMILNLGGPEKIEGLRYLALTSRWFATISSGQREGSNWLPISILGIGCELSTQEVTESWLYDNRKRLTAIGHGEPRTSGRVESYCFGLLEISTIEEGERGDFLPNPTRTVIKPLHRTLMEYLWCHGAIQSVQNLASPDHESFDANTAILLGLVVMEDHIYPLVSAWGSGISSLLDNVLIFNKLAEESTGSAQIALLSTFDRTVEAGFTALVRRFCDLDHDHEVSCCSRSPDFENLTETDAEYVCTFERLARSFALNPYHPLIPRKSWPEGFLDLLAITITCDANALLKHCISTVISKDASSEAMVSAEATRLLDLALNKSILLDTNVYVGKPNLEALQLLLQIGACPDIRLEIASAWEKFLDDLLLQAMSHAEEIIGNMYGYGHWDTKALHVLFSHGVRQNVHRIWAVMLEEPGQSPRPTDQPRLGERRVLEFRRYSVIQIIRQIASVMYQEYNAAQVDSHRHKHAKDTTAYVSEITELEKMRSQLELRDTDSAPTLKCRWSDLERVGTGLFSLDYSFGPRLRKAMASARRTGCDIAKYQQIRTDTSLLHEGDVIATWMPHGCRETQELPNDLVPNDEAQMWIDQLTLQDGQQAGFDVVGWLVYEEDDRVYSSESSSSAFSSDGSLPNNEASQFGPDWPSRYLEAVPDLLANPLLQYASASMRACVDQRDQGRLSRGEENELDTIEDSPFALGGSKSIQ